VTHHTVHWRDPYVILDYGDRSLCVQDALTHAVSVDLLCDCSIHCVQTHHNQLVFESSRDLVLAILYMGRYSQFSIKTVVEP